MVKICGYSDDIVDIVGSDYKEDEIGCFDADVRIWFTDGTVIRIGYSKPELAVWYIDVEEKGTAEQSLIICNDENAEVYSDVFSIDAEITRHEVIDH